MDACRLIGQVQNIEIVSPPSDSFGSKSKTALDDIARASRVWIREVALNENGINRTLVPFSVI